MSNVSGQIKFEDGDLRKKVKVTVTKKLRNTKKIRKNFKYAYFLISFMSSDSLCYYRHFDTTYVNSRKKQAPKINNEILKKIIKIKRKILPAMGPELWTFCLADQRLRPLGHNTSLYNMFLSTSIIQLF